MCTLQIRLTQDCLDRWRAGEPGAAAELLFCTGLWLELWEDISPVHQDAAEDALLQVLDELRRRGEDFSPKQFLEVYKKQQGRRRKDYLKLENEIKNISRSLDRPWRDGDREDDGDARSAYVGSSHYANPEHEALKEIQADVTHRLLRTFEETLTETSGQHFRAVEQALPQVYPCAVDHERAGMLLDFLHIGRAHREELAPVLMGSCCGVRNTYDTHNRRLRQLWRSFISESGAGHNEFAGWSQLTIRLLQETQLLPGSLYREAQRRPNRIHPVERRNATP